MANALLHFYFKITTEELESLDMEQWVDKYNQLVYAIEFDSKRLSGESNNKFPL